MLLNINGHPCLSGEEWDLMRGAKHRYARMREPAEANRGSGNGKRMS